MNGVSPRPVCQSRCCNPNASPSRTPVSASSIHSSLLRTDPRHCRASVSQLAHASQIRSICWGVKIGGGDDSATLPHTDHRLPAALAPGDVFQQRLVPAAATMRDPMQVPAHVHAVEHVVVVAGDHRRAAASRSSTRKTAPADARSRQPRARPRCAARSGRPRTPPTSPRPSAGRTHPGTATTAPAPARRTSPCSATPAGRADTPGTPRPAPPSDGPCPAPSTCAHPREGSAAVTGTSRPPPLRLSCPAP